MAADVLTSGFWEIGNYKHNVRRIKDGVDQLDDYAKMIRERAEIESKYGRALQSFAERWRGHVERSVHESSAKTAWLEVVSEADALAIQHNRVKDRMLEEIVQEITSFRKENHHTSAFRAPKEIREIEDGFEKAQRQWKKLHDKLEHAKRNYYSSCRQEKSTLVNLNNCQKRIKADSTISPDGAQKFKDRHEKAKEEVAKYRAVYQNHIQEINKYRPTYIEGMTFVFEKCQQMEMKRSQFFVSVMVATHNLLHNLVLDKKFSATHERIEATLKRTDQAALETDLQKWSSNYGKDATAAWPTFEEYTPEMRNIAHSRSKDAGGVVLTRQIIKSDDISYPGPASDNGKNSDSDSNTFDSRKTSEKKYKKTWQNIPADSPPLSTETPDSAKYGDFDEDFHTTRSQATVLYDYNPVEADEIKLKKGETIEVLSEPDSLGWCTGKRNGEVGLFPASYVQVV